MSRAFHDLGPSRPLAGVRAFNCKLTHNSPLEKRSTRVRRRLSAFSGLRVRCFDERLAELGMALGDVGRGLDARAAGGHLGGDLAFVLLPERAKFAVIGGRRRAGLASVYLVDGRLTQARMFTIHGAGCLNPAHSRGHFLSNGRIKTSKRTAGS